MSERSSRSPNGADVIVRAPRHSQATIARAGTLAVDASLGALSQRAKNAPPIATAATHSAQATATNGPASGSLFASAMNGFWHVAPGWLVSGAVHTAILVTLGLMVVAVEKGSSTEGLLGTFERGDQLLDASGSDVVELEVTDISDGGGSEGILGGLGGGGGEPGADYASTGTRLGGGGSVGMEISTPIEATGSGPAAGSGAGGSFADQIASVVGKGEALDRVVTGPPPGGGSGPVIGKGKASFFGVEAKGYKFVYVVDASGSMFGRRFSKAHAELVASLMALDEHQSFYVIFFNSTDYPQYYPLPEATLAPVSPKNLQKVIEWMGTGVTPFGETIPNSAISRALSLQPDAIFLLSDGEFSESAAYVVRQENYRNVPIHTIAFESELGAFSLSQIARMTRGTYRFVP